MEEYEAIEPNIWKPQDDGDYIEGILIAKKEGKFGHVYCFEWKEKQFVVFGSTIMDDRMNYVNPGDQVKIEFKGVTKNSKGQNTKIFKVFIKKKLEV